jgi:ABC-2 type transport system ATP-binding protein
MTPRRESAAIRTEGLIREFNGDRVVDTVNLEIPAGEIYGFLGPNGAGKSTTMRMLCTLLSPTGGRALVAGYDVATHPAQVRLRIGVALQDAALDPKQTGSELLRLQGLLYGLSRRNLERRLAELAEVRRLNEQLGMTIFLTTQYLEEADELAHRVGIIDHGRMVAEGTPAELKRSVGTDVIVARVVGDTTTVASVLESIPGVLGVEAHGGELVISTANGSATISPVAVALAGSEVEVRDLTLRTPTLDDVFLDLTGSHIVGQDAEEVAS